MSFDQAIERLNSAVTAHLSNVIAKIDGQDVSGLFDRAYVDVQGMASTGPILDVEASDVPYIESGAAVVIGVETFEVADVQPDGGGRVLLRLKSED